MITTEDQTEVTVADLPDNGEITEGLLAKVGYAVEYVRQDFFEKGKEGKIIDDVEDIQERIGEITDFCLVEFTFDNFLLQAKLFSGYRDENLGKYFLVPIPMSMPEWMQTYVRGWAEYVGNVILLYLNE